MRVKRNRNVLVVLWLAGSAGRKQLSGILRHVNDNSSWSVRLITEPKEFTGEAIRKTPWFRNTNDNTYLNFSDQTHLHALPRDLMARAGGLIREAVARARQDGDAGQRWRATMLMWYHEMYAARCLWGGAGRVRPDGSFGDVAEAADYVRALPEMCDACRRAIRLADRLEELRRVELGRPLPLIDRRRRDHYAGWGADVVYNPNFTMLMNRALVFRRRPEFTNALATAAGDARLFPDYAQTLRALADLSSATNCAALIRNPLLGE